MATAPVSLGHGRLWLIPGLLVSADSSVSAASSTTSAPGDRPRTPSSSSAVCGSTGSQVIPLSPSASRPCRPSSQSTSPVPTTKAFVRGPRSSRTPRSQVPCSNCRCLRASQVSSLQATTTSGSRRPAPSLSSPVSALIPGLRSRRPLRSCRPTSSSATLPYQSSSSAPDSRPRFRHRSSRLQFPPLLPIPLPHGLSPSKASKPRSCMHAFIAGFLAFHGSPPAVPATANPFSDTPGYFGPAIPDLAGLRPSRPPLMAGFQLRLGLGPSSARLPRPHDPRQAAKYKARLMVT